MLSVFLLRFVLQNIPRCVLQLVAVGCVFIATKQLEVRLVRFGLCVHRFIAFHRKAAILFTTPGNPATGGASHYDTLLLAGGTDLIAQRFTSCRCFVSQ
jgi:hypothetical protein